MTQAQAHAVKLGDRVQFGRYTYAVTSIGVNGVSAPYFRLAPVGGSPAANGRISFRLCTLV